MPTSPRSARERRSTASRAGAATDRREAQVAKSEKLPSRVITEGLDRAPHRAFLRAMGHDDAAIAKPFVGVASTGGSVTPCAMTLGTQAAEAKAGIVAGGATPFEFGTI